MNREFIQNSIIHICSEARNFDFLCQNLHGVDPIIVNDFLIKLESENKLIRLANTWTTYPTKQKKDKQSKSDKSLTRKENIASYIQSIHPYKVSHPLDFEWRNSQQTIDFLLNLIENCNGSNGRTLLLGMPTLFINSFSNHINTDITLIDKNELLLDSIKKTIRGNKRFTAINEDIFYADPKKVGQYKTVVMDPPWYSNHFFHFIWFASQCIEIGGSLIVSVPPINTRPGIDKERIEWFSYCQKHGLCLESLISRKLEYISPFFEFNAFRAAGLKDISPFWRKGDLAIFKRVHDYKISRPKAIKVEHVWQEREIESVRFRVKLANGSRNHATLNIKHLVKGDILPTVSSRDNRKENANLWTSGNRIFEITNPKAFIKCIDDGIGAGKEPSKSLMATTDFIKHILELENKEYQNYLDWLQHAVETKNH